MHNKRAALLELYDSHDVNLYSQLQFLKHGGYETILICSDRLKGEVVDYAADQDTFFFSITGKKGIALWKVLWAVHKILLEKQVGIVILNTAHGNTIRNFSLLPFPRKMKFFGTLHGVNKLVGSFTQKIISKRFNHYFVLIDYMLEKAASIPHKGIELGIYYPFFHPKFPAASIPEKKLNNYWIAVPGAVEYKRRDYTTLLEALSKTDKKLPLTFLLLGNGNHPAGNGKELKEEIAKRGLEAYFQFFEGFVPNSVMHACIQKSDAIMPLIHPINSDMEKYLENQMSGSYNLAFAYRKPLLMHEYFNRYADFRDTAFFYKMEDLRAFLADIPQTLAGSSSLYQNPKWTFEAQAQNFLRFIESV